MKDKRTRKTKVHHRSPVPPRYTLRFVAMVAGVVVLVSLVGFFLQLLISAEFLQVKHIHVEGNRYLSSEEVEGLLAMKNKGIFDLDFSILTKRIKTSPWIRSVEFRKELPDTLYVKVREQEPVALLFDGKKIYLVDEAGTKLARVETRVSHLPFIMIGITNESAYKEGIKLSLAISENSAIKGSPVEISGTRPEDISMKIDNTVVLIGSGDYERKLKNYLSLKDEIVKRQIPVEYIDVRFAHRLIVKPVKSET